MAFFRPNRSGGSSAQVVSQLNRSLIRLYNESIRDVRVNGIDPILIAEDTDVLLALASVRERLNVFAEGGQEQDPAPVVAEVTDEILERLRSSTVSRTRLGLSNIFATLTRAAHQLSAQSGPDSSLVETVVIPSEVLLRARQALFPAGRMQLMDGRRAGKAVRVGVPTDVTGDCSDGHVKPHSLKLDNARVSTQQKGNFLAMGLHSHPGEGPSAAVASSTDNEQHRYWTSHYWPLFISGTMVKDGFLRLYGDAIERKLVTVIVEGAGIERIPQAETDGVGTLYKVTHPIPNVQQAIDVPEKERATEESSTDSYATWEDFHAFEADIKDTLRSVLDFFTSYVADSGGHPNGNEAETLSAKLQG